MVSRALAATALVLVLGLAAPSAAGATEAGADADALGAAASWLAERQLPDGGFDADGSGVVTPDVILALGESAQTGPTWSRPAAITQVEATETAEGTNPLDAARRIARRTDDPGVVARLLLMVAQPLGIEATGDGPFGDLIGRSQRLLDAGDGDFVDHVELTTALLSVGTELPEGAIDRVIDAQQPDGGWNAEGDPDAEVIDLATTGATVSLLVLAGADPATGPVAAALAFVRETQAGRGWWPDADGERSAAATAGAVMAIRAAGYDPAAGCWPGAGSTSPIDALIALQGPDGGFLGADPVLVTAQAAHALSGNWLPRAAADDPCAADQSGFPVDPTLLVLAGIAVVGVGGGIRIMRSAPTNY